MPDTLTDSTISNSTWLITCPACGRWKTLAEVGGVRVGAASIGKRVLGICSACRRLRWMRVERPPQIPHDRLQTMLDATLGGP